MLAAGRLETALDYAEQNFSSRKIVGIAFVALLHVAIIYALLSGLGEQAAQVLQPPLQAKIIQDVTPPQLAPPPPPPPLVAPAPIFIPPPLVQIAAPPPPLPVIAAVTHVKPASPPPAPAPAPVAAPQVARSGPSLDPNQSCAPPQYPEEAEDMEQTGTSVLQFLISTDGTVLNSKVANSSGHASLDEAAVAALSRCRFKPAIGADGKPQQAWTNIRYVWQLQ